MKKLFVSIAAMTMLLATGCQNEELVQQGNAGDYTLTLDMGAQSRTMHDENGECVWGENEQLYVVGDGGKVFGTLTMKSKSEDGKKAVFSGKVTGDPAKLRFMVYPVPEPDGTIPMGDIDGTNHNAPMTGSISGGVVENVDYAGGLVKVPVSGVDDIKVSAENGDGKVLTGGSYTFNPETGELVFNPNTGASVTITNVSETNGFVYVPVETEVEDNSETSEEETEEVTVTVTIGEGEEKVEQSFETKIQEGAITTNGVPSFDANEEGKITVSVGTEALLRSALATGGDIKLTNNIVIGEKAMTISDGKLVNLNLMGYAVQNGTITNNGTLTIMSDSVGIGNVCNFELNGVGQEIIMGGVFSGNGMTLKEGYTFVTYNNVHVALPNEGYIIVGNVEEIASELMKENDKIAVLLANNIDLPITELGNQTPGSGEYKLGGENTEEIIINLNGNKLNITTGYWSAIGAKNDNATFTIKNGVMTSSQTSGTCNSYDLTFANCNYLIEDVVFNKSIALVNEGKNITMNRITINESHDYYAIWITAEGQIVDINGLNINSGRGIKIDEQYVNTGEEVTLEVSDATFKTLDKAAIMVKSSVGADITLEKIDISGVAKDKTNAVWVDEDSADYFDLVTVTGGTVVQELKEI